MSIWDGNEKSIEQHIRCAYVLVLFFFFLLFTDIFVAFFFYLCHHFNESGNVFLANLFQKNLWITITIEQTIRPTLDYDDNNNKWINWISSCSIISSTKLHKIVFLGSNLLSHTHNVRAEIVQWNNFKPQFYRIDLIRYRHWNRLIVKSNIVMATEFIWRILRLAGAYLLAISIGNDVPMNFILLKMFY